MVITISLLESTTQVFSGFKILSYNTCKCGLSNLTEWFSKFNLPFNTFLKVSSIRESFQNLESQAINSWDLPRSNSKSLTFRINIKTIQLYNWDFRRLSRYLRFDWKCQDYFNFLIAENKLRKLHCGKGSAKKCVNLTKLRLNFCWPFRVNKTERCFFNPKQL